MTSDMHTLRDQSLTFIPVYQTSRLRPETFVLKHRVLRIDYEQQTCLEGLMNDMCGRYNSRFSLGGVCCFFLLQSLAVVMRDFERICACTAFIRGEKKPNDIA
jgi:hypothetical protein